MRSRIPAPIEVSYERDFWRETVADFEASGLTEQAYAKANNLSKWALRWWLVKLRDEPDQADEADSLEEATLGGGAVGEWSVDDNDDRTADEIIVSAAEKYGSLQTAHVERAFEVSKTTARRYLKALVDEGRMQIEGENRETRYVVAMAS